MTGDGKNLLQGGAGMFFEPILSNVYRAYGNRTPPYYNLINPRNPPFPDPTERRGHAVAAAARPARIQPEEPVPRSVQR